MRRLALTLVLTLSACGAGKRLDPKRPYEVFRAPLTVRLTDTVDTYAELTFPAAGRGPHPTVILVHGSGPQDRDATLEGPVGTTRLFADLAEHLSARGFAVLRYDKRHVRGPGDYDLPSFFADQSTFAFRDDLEAVLAFAKRHPRVDPDRVFLYGWSEGSVVATAVAVEHPELAGLVLQGPVGEPWDDLVRGWFTELTVPYLHRFTRDGAIDGRMLARAMNSAASLPVVMTTSMLAVSWSRKGEVAQPSPFVDGDRDGRIVIADELEPRIDDLVKLAFSPLGAFLSYAEGNTLAPVPALIAPLKPPVLVLQGEHDAHTPPVNTQRVRQALADANHPDATTLTFPGLGHTLGPADDPVDDLGRPMAAAPRDALVDWLVARARR